MTAPLRRSTTIDGSAGGDPLSCGIQSTYNRVANAGNLYRLSPFQMPFGILHNLTGKISLTFPLEESHFITGYLLWGNIGYGLLICLYSFRILFPVACRFFLRVIFRCSNALRMAVSQQLNSLAISFGYASGCSAT